MAHARYFTFEAFCLDAVDERLWNEDADVALGRKAFAVLTQLVRHANQLVTKDDLLSSVWPDVSVGEAVLSTAIREIRAAIGDTARMPRFIQTVHGRGYRFIAPVADTRMRAPSQATESGLVGRRAEFARLCEWYSAIQQGTRRLGFIAGEAGIGKTSLIEDFIAAVVSPAGVLVGRGQCVEQYGGGEPYLPILEALARLGRQADAPIRQLLREHAPTWLAHLPSLALETTMASSAVRPERMLRELAEALEALTAIEPLVLVFEDLHWSDRATLQCLGYLARRRDPARLLVLGTYRPVEALMQRTSLRDVLIELRYQPQAGEIVLDYLSKEAVHDYLRRRYRASITIDELGDLLYRRTGGHPLFLASIVEGTVPTDLDVAALARAIPPTVRQFIEYRFAQLSEAEQTILDAASVAASPSFSVAAVIASTSLPEQQIDETCAAWTRDARILVADGVAVWPDGTVGARYAFRHDLFQEVACARIPPERRARLHHLIGSRLELAHGAGAASIAAELAMHFEHGRDRPKALLYLEHAARNAMHRSAYAEARDHLVRALPLTEALPDDRARLDREATLFLLFAQVLGAVKGWADDEVMQAYSSARERAIALQDEPRRLHATWGLVAGSIVRAELQRTQELTREVLTLAKRRHDRLFRMAAHMELGGTALVLAQSTVARRHFRLAERLDDPGAHQTGLETFGIDPGIFARIWSTHLLWYQGFPEQARIRADETLRLAAARQHPFTWTIATAYAAMLCQFLRDVTEVDRLTAATIVDATRHGFPYYRAWAEVLRGWSRVTQGGGEAAVDEIRHGIQILQVSARLRLPYYQSLLADAYGHINRVDEGLAVVTEALAAIDETGERWWEPELHRRRGVLLQMAGRIEEAERCLCDAITAARQQHAKFLELRATLSLATLWPDQRQSRRAHRDLRAIYDQFSEGFDLPDLRDARAQLRELGQR